MKLEFNNINEIIDFLKELGYTVEKCNWKIDKVCSGIDEKEENSDEKKESLEDWWKKIPQNPYPLNPYNPYYPNYPNYPIVTFDAMNDPSLSEKFGRCKAETK